MANELLNSPAEIVAELLIQLGVGSDPSANPAEAWPVYVDEFNDAIDQQITVQDTLGTSDGRAQFDGELFCHYGFQVLVRAKHPRDGWRKADEVRQALVPPLGTDGAGSGAVVLVTNADGTNGLYEVVSINQISPVIRNGREPTSARRRWSVNATATIQPYSFPTPAAYYPFDGDATDHGSNGLNLTASNVTYAAGKLSQAAILDAALPADLTVGSNPAIEFGVGDSFSISLWLRLDSNGTHVVLAKALGGFDGYNLTIESLKSGGMRPSFVFCVGEAESIGDPITSGPDWHHVVCTYDAAINQVGIWLNGVQGEQLVPATPAADGGTPLWVGRHWNPVTPFPLDGAIDDLVIAPVVFSPTEIAALYNGGTGRTYL